MFVYLDGLKNKRFGGNGTFGLEFPSREGDPEIAN